MARRTKLSITEDFSEALKKYAHLRAYVKKITATVGEPEYHLSLDRALKFQDYPNIIYPVGDPMFVHIYKERGVVGKQYVVIEPTMDDETRKKYDIIMDRMIELANRLPVPDKTENIGPVLIKIFDEVVEIEGKKKNVAISNIFSNKMILSKEEYEIMKYFLLRDRVGYSKLEPMFNDPYLEDI